MRTLSFEPPRSEDRPRHWQTVRTLLPYLWPPGMKGLRARVVIALLLLAGAKIVNVATPFLGKAAVDALNRDIHDVIYVPVAIILAFGLARVMAQAFGELRDAVFVKVGQRALRTIALQVFRHMHRLALRFHLERRTGGLSRAIERGTRGIDFLLRFMLFSILPTILEILLVTGIMFYHFNYMFALVTLLSVGGYVVFTLFVTEWRTKFRREMNEQDTVANTKAIDSLLNFETVKYFGNEEHEARRFDLAMERYERAAVKSQTSLTLLNVGQGAIIATGLCVALILTARGVVDGRYTLGDYFLVSSLLLNLYMPLNFLGFVYREIKQSLVDMENMFELLEKQTEISDAPDARPLATNGAEIVFDRVSFRYEPDRQILHDVSFRVPAGKTVAIVGPSGAGKSTISRILFRFYDIEDGAVRIDGQDVRAVTQESLRAAIGIVPQDTVLFNDTIRYNIRYGRPRADADEVAQAARLAAIHNFVEGLPQGFETMVGERGLKLSGGEKQRVAIARTILKDPPILLFDEATSALDTHTEKEIQAALKEVSRNRTTLVIAHRLSTVIDADQILVLDAGRIVERGGHEALLAHGGVYATMWQRQQEAVAVQNRLKDLVEVDAV
ncbi:MAG: ABCB family ABC transporter ATP-binding protein/permease [Sphingomonadales bacterium]